MPADGIAAATTKMRTSAGPVGSVAASLHHFRKRTEGATAGLPRSRPHAPSALTAASRVRPTSAGRRRTAALLRQRERRQGRRARRFEALPRSLLFGRLRQGAAGSLADLRAAARLHRPPAIVCGVRLPAHHFPHLDHGRRDGAASPAALRVSRRDAPMTPRSRRRRRASTPRDRAEGLRDFGL
jgi:hypothetical protein